MRDDPWPLRPTGRELYDAGVRLFVVLDFDGVINVFPAGDSMGADPDRYDDFQTFRHALSENSLRSVYPITWSPSMIAALNAVLSDPTAQLCWLTSWRGLALKPAARMGLAGARPPTVIPHGRMFDSDSQAGKPEGLIGFLEGVPSDAGVIWCDDNLHTRGDDPVPHEGWGQQVRDHASVALLDICPAEETGISKSEMARMAQFAKDTPRLGTFLQGDAFEEEPFSQRMGIEIVDSPLIRTPGAAAPDVRQVAR